MGIKYKTIIEQYLFGYLPDNDITAIGVIKDDALEQINHALGTNYQRTHMDNWIARRKPTPRRITDLCWEHIYNQETGENANFDE